jgi:hypothetical protein
MTITSLIVWHRGIRSRTVSGFLPEASLGHFEFSRTDQIDERHGELA